MVVFMVCVCGVGGQNKQRGGTADLNAVEYQDAILNKV